MHVLCACASCWPVHACKQSKEAKRSPHLPEETKMSARPVTGAWHNADTRVQSTKSDKQILAESRGQGISTEHQGTGRSQSKELHYACRQNKRGRVCWAGGTARGKVTGLAVNSWPRCTRLVRAWEHRGIGAGSPGRGRSAGARRGRAQIARPATWQAGRGVERQGATCS